MAFDLKNFIYYQIVKNIFRHGIGADDWAYAAVFIPE
jgi:hypothetical protein